LTSGEGGVDVVDLSNAEPSPAGELVEGKSEEVKKAYLTPSPHLSP